MKKFVTLALLLLLLASCKYKDLCYDHDHWPDYNLILELDLKLELDVDLDVSDEAHTKINEPTYMVVQFYDILSGALCETEIVGPHGGPMYVAPGRYNMVVYAFDTEWTQIRGENNVSTLEAFTSDITASKSQLWDYFKSSAHKAEEDRIIYTPDHLLVAQQIVEIPPFSIDQPVITVEDTAVTIVETYGFEVPNITGIEYVSSVEAFVTNQAASCFFGRGEKNTEPVTVSFPVEIDWQQKIFKTTFNTFGKLPGESDAFLNIVIIDTQGKPFTVIEEITDQFDNPDRVIIINDSIDIPKPDEAGGIAPTVEEWKEEIHDIPIG